MAKRREEPHTIGTELIGKKIGIEMKPSCSDFMQKRQNVVRILLENTGMRLDELATMQIDCINFTDNLSVKMIKVTTDKYI